jgi:hypothetical protein
METAEILISLIDWQYQRVFHWLVIGLFSMITIILYRKINKVLSVSSVLFFALVFSFLLSMEKVFDHWYHINFYTSRLSLVLGNSVTLSEITSLTSTGRLFPQILESTLNIVISNRPFEVALIRIAFLLGTLVYVEKVNDTNVIRNTKYVFYGTLFTIAIIFSLMFTGVDSLLFFNLGTGIVMLAYVSKEPLKRKRRLRRAPLLRTRMRETPPDLGEILDYVREEYDTSEDSYEPIENEEDFEIEEEVKLLNALKTVLESLELEEEAERVQGQINFYERYLRNE